jgi:hypothetical protein
MRVLICISLTVATMAFAQSEPERPWARGVPKERQTVALQLFRDGNAKLRDALYRAAREKYAEALKAWDHPAIHYNLSLTLMNLDQPVEAYEHLLLALKFGAAPLDAEKMDQALRYKGLVEKQLTKLSVTCDLEGATVRVDGNQLFVGPGRWDGMVRAGPHQIVATRDGYVPVERAEVLVGGDAKQLALTLYRTEDLTEYRRLWPAAIPWVVLIGGGVVIGGSVALHAQAKGAFDAYDKGVTGCAQPETLGCVPRTDLAGLRTQGQTLQTLAFIGYVLGGAAAVTGGVLAYLNRPLPFIRTVDVAGARVTLFPTFGPSGPGAFLSASF